MAFLSPKVKLPTEPLQYGVCKSPFVFPLRAMAHKAEVAVNSSAHLDRICCVSYCPKRPMECAIGEIYPITLNSAPAEVYPSVRRLDIYLVWVHLQTDSGKNLPRGLNRPLRRLFISNNATLVVYKARASAILPQKGIKVG